MDAAIYAENQKEIAQWDEYALKIGSVTDKFHALLNEVQQQGQDFGGKIFSSMSKAVDDLSTQLAKHLVVTGKSNFRELFQSFEESVAKQGRLPEIDFPRSFHRSLVSQVSTARTLPEAPPALLLDPLASVNCLAGSSAARNLRPLELMARSRIRFTRCQSMGKAMPWPARRSAASL